MRKLMKTLRVMVAATAAVAACVAAYLGSIDPTYSPAVGWPLASLMICLGIIWGIQAMKGGVDHE
jgi:hypothetical protein